MIAFQSGLSESEENLKMLKKILLIEDDPTMRKLLETYLNFEGFEVSVSDGEDRLEMVIAQVKQEKPDVVLMDVYLNTLNGFDLLRAMRRDEKISDVRVIMSSGADVSERCIVEGADAFVMKPYMPDDLVKSIRRVIAGESDQK
jgi:DNA-binding response OmpR family regulator